MEPPILPIISKAEYAAVNSATDQIHVAAQLLAKAGAAFVSHKSDDSHTNLGWDVQNGLFYTHSLLADKDLHLCLDPANLRLFLLENQEEQQSFFELHQQGQAAAETWIKSQALQFGLSPAAYRDELHYELPPYGDFAGKQFLATPPEGFRAFSRLRSWGELLLQELAQAFVHASEVRTWPHHFDHGTYIPLAFDNEGQACKSIGLGLAIHDHTLNEHYFYINHWNRDAKPDYNNLPALPCGRWNKMGWVGPLLPCSEIIGMEDQKRGLKAVLDFFAAGIDASLKIIDHSEY